jgi:hypothetical protein
MAHINEDKDSLKFAGDYNLDVCTIISYRKSPDQANELVRFNILPQVMSLSLVEDVTLQCITGEINVADAQDLRTVLPLTGLERLELKFYTPGTSNDNRVDALEETNEPFYIYKIEKIRPSGGTGRQQVYRLHFTSREAYRNSITRVSKAFAGPVENGVAEILLDKKFLDSRKPFYVEETKTNAKYVIPNVKPFKAIQMLASQAISKNYKNANFLFYETIRGYNFRSIESLLALGGHTARPVVEKYHLQPANTRVGGNKDITRDMRNVSVYSFEDPVNVIESLNNGLYASKMISHDAFNKTITETDFDYHGSFVDFFHTEHADGGKSGIKFIHPYANFDNTEKNLSEQPNAKLLTISDTDKIHNAYEKPPVKDIIQNALSQREQMANFNLVMTVPGNTKVHAGDLISFALPFQKPVAPDESQELNPYYSGRYLVLQVKHIVNNIAKKHEMIMRCVKDAVSNPLPAESDNITVKLQDHNNRQVVNVYEEDEQYIRNSTLDIDKSKTEILT